jgi:amidase
MRPRALAPLTLIAAAVLLTAPSPAGAVPADGDCLRTHAGLDLQTADVAALQQALQSGRTTSVALVDAYLARIAAYDSNGPALNSIRVIDPAARARAAELDAARAAGSTLGPLHGIPVVLKDNIGTTSVPTTAGSVALEGSIPLHEAFVTERLEAAGAIVMGKTNLSEFANWVALGMPNGYSSLGGQVLNAHDLGDPSGSSSGSGVAMSMAFAAGAFGSETSGSILSPSSANGVVGIKPTVGLVSRAGVIPLAPSFDTAGPMTRNVHDAAVLLGAVAGPDPRDAASAASADHLPEDDDYTPFLLRTALEGVRLGYSEGNTGDEVFDQALADLEAQGAELVAIDSLDSTAFAGLTEIAAIPNEFKWSLNRYLADETVPDLRVRTLSDIIEYNKTRPDEVKYGQNLLEASDATPGLEALSIAQSTPTVQSARAAIDAAMLEGDVEAIVAPGASNANIGAAAGYPSVMVPAGYAGDVRPQGLSFLGAAWSEPRLIGFAYAYEQGSLRRLAPTTVNTDLVEGVRCGTPPTPGPRPRPRPSGPAAEPLPTTGGGTWPAAAAVLLVLAGLSRARASRRAAG